MGADADAGLSCAPMGARASGTPSSSPISSNARTMSPAKSRLPFGEHDVHVIGFPGCYPNAYAETMMARLCTHPNVGAALLVSLGCESFNRNRLAQAVRESGRPAQTIVIQASGGTRKSIAEGRAFVARQRALLDAMETVPMAGERTHRRHRLRRLRRDVRHHRQSRRRPRLRHAGRGGRRVHLRGDRRVDRLRAHHGRSRHHAETSAPNSRPASPRPRATTPRSAMARSPRAMPKAV